MAPGHVVAPGHTVGPGRPLFCCQESRAEATTPALPLLRWVHGLPLRQMVDRFFEVKYAPAVHEISVNAHGRKRELAKLPSDTLLHTGMPFVEKYVKPLA